jgi:hypothetical protein
VALAAVIPLSLEKLTSLNLSPSDLAAWWGAIAATVALSWNILRAARSNGRIKLQGIYQLDSTKPILPPVFAVRVTNVGSKPILIQGIAIQLKKGSTPTHHFSPCETPMMLARGMSFLQVIDRTGWLPTDAERLYAWDSSGKHWYLRRKELRWLLDQRRRFITAKSKQVVAL